MKRKTNLFYTTGYDSKFLTFSNYTESMTGNFLSTNTKLFPSRFIALKIEHLTPKSKRHLIKYLALYYESKLAVCRDELEKKNELPEDHMLPLNYLLEALYSISELNDDGLTLANGIMIIDTDDIPDLPEIDNTTEDDSTNTSTDVDNNVNIYGSDTPDPVNHHDPASDNDIVIDTGNMVIGDSYTSNDDSSSDEIDDDYEPDDSMYDVEENIPDFKTLNIRIDGRTNTLLTDIVSLNYIGEITEQNYNGTFTDTICIIDLNNYRKPTPVLVEDASYNDDNVEITLPISNKYLDDDENPLKCIYGWENNVLEKYKGDASIFDADNSLEDPTGNLGQYRLKSYFNKLNIEGNTENYLEFNCIIPLYDMVNTDWTMNFSDVKEISEILLTTDIDKDENTTTKMYNLNVPLGIWFNAVSDDENENVIKLYRDSETGFSQSWSLTISSQFKPFPYSQSMPNEICTNEDSSAFMTFAQVLSNQNRLIEKFNEFSQQYHDLDIRLKDIQSQLNNIGTLYNIDNVHKEMLNFENSMNNKYVEFTDTIYSYINNLRWKVTQ